MKTLLSWIAFNNDFKEGKVDPENSPNYNMHKHFWTFDRHIILCSAKDDDTRAKMLVNILNTDFPGRDIEIRYMNVPDVIDLAVIKGKVETFLLSLKNDEITIFFSPGTSAMQVSWYICHTSLGLKTRLVQMRPAAKSAKKQNELLEMKTEQSAIPYTSILKEQLMDDKDFDNKYLITDSIKKVYSRAEKIASTDKVTVLINGASGTGKEHLARYLHEKSIRKNKPYVPINCSAFNDQLLESRLFGYKKGSFTGAEKDTAGLFEDANGGTIFLDEIGDITPYMQQALLRVLQEKEIQPVGGKSRKIDVRIISATNKNLIQLCNEGKFRWDLFYRLAAAELEIPSLRERGAKDIEKLVEFFIQKKKKDLNKAAFVKVDSEVSKFLLNYGWPGNVRELENLIETFYVFAEGEITMKDLPARLKELNETTSLKWEDVEKAHIIKVLKLKNGNQRQAWMALGYKSINTFRSRLKEYGIDVEVLENLNNGKNKLS